MGEEGSESCFQVQKQSDSINGEQECRLISIQRRKKQFLILLNCNNCFLFIQLTGTNGQLPIMHNVPPEVDFESSRSPAKSEC